MALVFAYGVGVGKWEWFPHSYLNKALNQARALTGSIEASHRKVFNRQGARTVKEGKTRPGMTAITSWWQTPNGLEVGIKLMDERGDVLHEWLTARGDVFEDDLLQRKDPKGSNIHGSLLLPNGDVLITLEYVGTARLDACGEVLWTLSEGNHHAMSRAEDGTFWIPATSQTRRSGSEQYPDFPGIDEVWVDRILHVSEDGKVLQDINVLDILYSNGLERYLFQGHFGGGPPSGDVTHLNDVEPLSSSLSDDYPIFDTGDLLVSARNVNLVFVLDPDTGEIKWHTDGPFILQHDPDYIGDGWIGVFDNQAWAPGGSRILGFQPHTDSMKVLFQGKHLDRFSTGHKGMWQMLENGNMLLTEEETGRVIEVSEEGKLVWEWVHEPYGSRVPSVSKATRVDLTREEVASWSCSSVDSVSTAQNQQTVQ